jgi:hypothetical protein
MKMLGWAGAPGPLDALTHGSKPPTTWPVGLHPKAHGSALARKKRCRRNSGKPRPSDLRERRSGEQQHKSRHRNTGNPPVYHALSPVIL